MRIREFFPTLVYTAALQKSGAREPQPSACWRNASQIREDDAGRPPLVGPELYAGR